MSKRDMRARRLLAAVLLAMSVQVWYAQPLWAAQSAAVTTTKTTDKAEDNAASTTTNTETNNNENEEVTVTTPTIAGYGISPRLAGASTYAVETIGDIKVSGGMMQGVTSINNANFTVGDENIAIGKRGTQAQNNGLAFGYYAQANGLGSSVALGNRAYAEGVDSVIVGSGRAEADYSVGLGNNTLINTAHTNGVAIGYMSTTTAANQVSFGQYDRAYQRWDILRSLVGISDIEMAGALSGVTTINGAAINTDGNNLSIGVSASVTNSSGGGTAFGNSTVITNANSSIFGALAQAQADNTTAIGYSAYANGDKSTALGASASSLGQGSMALGSGATVAAEHRKSIAIGYGSKTSDSNQVAFGDMTNPISFRSLAGITDIRMTGTIYANGIDNLTKINSAFYSVSRGSYSLVLGNLTDDGVLNGATIFGVTGNVKGTGVSVFGGKASVRGNNSSAFGNGASVGGANSSVFGAEAGTFLNSTNNSAFGTQAMVASSNGSSFGYRALVKDNADGSLALGASSTVESGHTGSVAIGSGSKTSAANQVVFGDMTTPASFRSLAGIKDIALTGKITGLTAGTDATDAVNVGQMNTALTGKADTTAVTDLQNKTVNLSTNGGDLTNMDSVVSKTAQLSNVDFSGNGVVRNVNSINGAVFQVNPTKSIAVGSGTVNVNSSDLSSVFGMNVTISGNAVTAVGSGSIVSANAASAFGQGATVTGLNGSAFGIASKVEAANGVALGAGATVGAGHDKSIAIGESSKTNAANQVVFGDMTTPTSFRSLAGIKDIALTGAIIGATSINGIGIDSSRNLTNVGTINGIDLANLGGGSVDFTDIKSNIVVKKADSTETFKVDQNTGNVTTSGTVTSNEFIEGGTKLSDKYAGKNEAYTDAKAALKADKTYVDSTFAKATEVNTALNDKANADASGLSDPNKASWKAALGVDTLATTVAGKADKANTLSGYGITDAYTQAQVNTKLGEKVDVIAYNSKVSTLESADTALQTKTTNLSTDGTALTGMTNIASTSATLGNVTFAAGGVVTNIASINGIGIDGSRNLTNAGTYNGVTIGSGGINGATITSNSFNGAVISSSTFNGVDVGALKNTVDNLGSSGGVTAENTAGITRAKIDPGAGTGADNFKTTVETNTNFTTAGITTNAITASGTVTANEFVEGGQALSAKYAGKNEAYTDAKAALKADKTYVDGNFAKSTDVYTKTEVNTELGNKANADASGLSDPNKTAWKSALGVDTLENTVAGKADATTVTALETKTSNLSPDGATLTGMTNITSTSATLGGVSLQNGQLGSVIKLNNAIIGTDIKGITIDGVGLKSIAGRVDALEQSGGGGGGSSQNTAGIKRTDTDGDIVDDTTTIENATSFTTDGMKTSNLQAAMAAIGGVNFGGSGAMTNVTSINGISFVGGKVGGVSLSGGRVDGVSISGLDNRVTALENSSGGGGSGGTGGNANTAGITRPDTSHTTIEGNTTIGADGVDTNDLTASGSITVAKGEINQTVIDKDGIHVGKNSSVVNDTDGFITDKGLYIGVESSSNLGSAKFSVVPNGNLSSTAGNYGFSNTSTDGAKFTDTSSVAHGGGSVMDTTIKGNTVTTGRVDTDELYVGGNKVVISGSTVQPGTHINNHLEGTDASGNAVTNDFITSALNGTTQSAEQVSADGKNTIKTTNNTSATGTSNTTTKTDVDGSDNKTVQKSELTTNENGMKLNTSNTVTDKGGTVTSSSSGATTMTGDSLTVSKTTTTKDADGNDVTKTSSTTVGSGEVTLNREDGSSIRVGDAIEGLQSDVQELGGRINEMGVEIKEVGALSAALAGLHPQPQNANTKADFAMAMGSYEGKQALAVGAFYKPDKRTMLSLGASTTSSKHMMNMGISIALDRMPEAERAPQEAGTADNETLNKVLERLASLEKDNQRLAADNKQMALENARRDAAYAKLADNYNDLKEKYSKKKPAEKTDDAAVENADVETGAAK